EGSVPVRDVNHDLIAAGHPRLNFEFAAFQANMPKHWEPTADEKKPEYEFKSWAVGQAASAKAALDLLAYRAGHESQPWPEFTEYGCFACHHDLGASKDKDKGYVDWRQTPEHYKGRRPGALPWGTWYFALLPAALESQGDAAVGKNIDELR